MQSGGGDDGGSRGNNKFIMASNDPFNPDKYTAINARLNVSLLQF